MPANLFAVFYVFLAAAFLIGSAAESQAKDGSVGGSQSGAASLFFDAQQCSAASDCAIMQCNTASCDLGECAYTPMLNGTQCNDKYFCNGAETCQNGICQDGAPIVCAPDSVACTVESCNEATRKCTSTLNNSLCNDSISCTNDTCDARRGCIFVPENLLCDDGISCTVDTCASRSGCENNASACTVCTLLGVSWSTSSVLNGQPVTITAASTGCADGETVDLELWESDGSNGSGIVTGIALPSIALNQGTGSIIWTAVWTSDSGDPPGFMDNALDPEYLVKAMLHSNPSQIAFTQTNLIVTDNVPQDSNAPRYNYCPTPIGIRPCTAAVWKSSPDCKWDTSQCSPDELNKECSPGDKRCSGNALQECRVAVPALWANIQQCANGCNQEMLSCNSAPCIVQWNCTEWSSCANNVESRLCTDTAQCGTFVAKPVETRTCSSAAVCGDGTCGPEENRITCPSDCKGIELPGLPTEQLALIALVLLIFAGLAIAITHVLSARQRL